MPSELTLLFTKGIDSNLVKPPPYACALTTRSDPCYVKAYYVTDANDGRLKLHLKILNLTVNQNRANF